MKAIILLALVAVATASYDWSHVKHTTMAGHQNVARQLTQALNKVKQYQAPPKMHTQAITPACYTQLYTLVNITTQPGGCAYDAGIFDFINLTQDKLAGFCATTGTSCAKSLTDTLAAIKTSCTAADVEELRSESDFTNSIQQAQTVINAICTTKEGTEYCYAKFRDFQGADYQNMNSTTLTKFCSPCALKIAAGFGGLSNEEVVNIGAMLQLYCLKRGEEFCWLTFQAFPEKFSAANEGVDENTPPNFAALCDPCVLDFARAALVVGSSGNPLAELFQGIFSKFITIIKGFCALDESGQTCANRLLSVGQEGAKISTTCPKPITATAPCTGECLAAVGAMRGALGCCFGSIFGAISAMFSGMAPGSTSPFLTMAAEAHSWVLQDEEATDPSGMSDWLQKQCGFPFGNGCSGTRVKAKLFVKNLLYQWYLEHKAEVDLKVKLDLAAHFKLDVDSVYVTGSAEAMNVKSGLQVQAVTAGVTFDYEVVPDTPARGTEIENEIKAGVVVPTPSLSTLPLSARKDPQEAVVTDGDAAKSSVTVVRSAATVVGASVSLIIAAAVAAVAVAC